MDDMCSPELPLAKLPHFGITRPHTASEVVTSYVSTICNVSILNNDQQSREQAVLRQFALFASDVVGSEQVAFLASGGCIEQTFIKAETSDRGAVKLESFPCEDIATARDIDFHLYFSSHSIASMSESSYPSVPLLLLVELAAMDLANISLRLRSDYGSSIAAKHLAALAVAYLRSEFKEGQDFGADLEPSRINLGRYLANKPGISTTNGLVNDEKSENNKYQDKFGPCLIHTAFEENARLRPDNIAIEYLSSTPTPRTISARGDNLECYRSNLTYAELDDQANKLALQLGLLLRVLEDRWRPVLQEQYAFPLCIPPSPELFLAMLAAVKSGHAFCSLPSDAPKERIKDIVEDLGSPVVLGVGAVPWNGLTETKHGPEEIMWIDITNPSSWSIGQSTPVTPDTLLRVPKEDDVCYLFYTSGSTGKPKGVLGSHRAAVACIQSTIAIPLAHLPSGPRLRWLNMSAPSFDPVIVDTFVPLSKGGTLCVAQRDLLLTDLEACARELRATASYAVASLALLIRPENVPELKTLIVGGESVSARVVEKFARVPGSTAAEDDRYLVNAYGPTETTIFMTAESCTQSTRSSIIGDALPTALCLVVDPDSLDAGVLKEMPLGLAGELVVGGPQVALGYLNRPKETARTFLPAERFPALGLSPRTMLYRTGDKVRIVWSADEEPRIDFMGRIGTDQVKLSGRRVELTEIENTLTRTPGVASAAVVLVKGLRAELVAFIKLWPGHDATDVVTQCGTQTAEALPKWMCPGRYVVLDNLPWTASGKIDRKTLTVLATGDKPLPHTRELGVSSSAASGIVKEDVNISVEPIEKAPLNTDSIVDQVLIEALGYPAADLTKDTSLLSLGMDSLRAMVVLQHLRDCSIRGLSIGNILACQTITDLTHLVESTQLSLATQDKETKILITEGNIDGCIETHEGMNVENVSAIPLDGEVLYELPISTRLRHFHYHCLDQCTSALNLEPEDIEQILPTTNTQTRILYIATCQQFVDPSRYSGRPQIEHFLYNLQPRQVDPVRLKKAVEVVLGRHDIFRAVYCKVEHPLSPFALCVLKKDSMRATLPTVEIVCKPGELGEESNSLWQNIITSTQIAAESSMVPNRPGVTLSWVRSSDGSRHVMILSLSHQAYDGVLLQHLRREIAVEYSHPGRVTQDLFPLRKSIELMSSSSDWTETMFYWIKRFSGIPNFRFGSHRPVSQSPHQLMPFTIEETTHMRRLALISTLSMQEISSRAVSDLGTTLAAVVQTAWASALLQTHTAAGLGDKLDVQFGNIAHGRHTPELWHCMTPLVATVPMHLPIDKQSRQTLTNRDVCRHFTSQLNEVARYLDIPCLSLDMFELGHNRFDTILNIQAYVSDRYTSSAEKSVGDTLLDLPGWNYVQNLLLPYKETDIGAVVMLELWPGFNEQGLDWREKVMLKLTYNARRPGYEFLNDQWVIGMLGAMEDALVRILNKPDQLFYIE